MRVGIMGRRGNNRDNQAFKRGDGDVILIQWLCLTFAFSILTGRVGRCRWGGMGKEGNIPVDKPIFYPAVGEDMIPVDTAC